MVEPTELLENLGMGGRVIEDTLICGLGAIKLDDLLDWYRQAYLRNHLRLFVARERDRSGTKCPLV